MKINATCDGSVTEDTAKILTYLARRSPSPPTPTESKLPSVIDRSVTTISAEDLAGATSIGSGAFRGCTKLTNITIPDSVTSIGFEAFANCTSLTNITIPDSVTSIGDSAFFGCTKLTNITIPNSVTGIGQYAFGNCESLMDIAIPDSVESIEDSAFRDCGALKSVIIGNNIRVIQAYAFCDCYSLNSITISRKSPPTLDNNAFLDTNNCPIYVPAESVGAYKTATNWSSIADRIFAIPE